MRRGTSRSAGGGLGRRDERTVDLAGVGVVFEGGDRWREVLASRFGAFVGDRPARWRVTLEARGRLPADLPSPLAVRHEGSRLERCGGRLTVVGETFVAEADVVARKARVEGPAAAYPVDALLHHLLPLLVDDGLVVHGVLLAEGGSAWVCSGPSGCGKSTLARLRPGEALCDELAALRRRDDGWVASALPFWEGRPGQGRLQAVAILGHGPVHRRTPVAPARLARALSEQILWPLHDAEAVAGCFGRLADLAAEVPAFELRFAPRADVWPVVSGREPR